MGRANQAYYAGCDPFADFTTAPEISQMFGELIGAWAAVVWQAMGAPAPLLLVEAGPGRGTLMQDALRAVARVAPEFARAAQLHLIETSPHLRAAQAARLPGAVWHADLESVPRGPAIVIANEFLDALPIRQFVRTPAGWAERYVQAGKFTEMACTALDRAAPVGAVVEIGEAGLLWAGALARRLAHEGGAALLLDYGTAETLPGDSLQALRDARPADPLAAPGRADLTAHVDFAAVARAAQAAGAAVWGPVGQGAFLAQLGLAARVTNLSAARPDRSAALREAAERLAAPTRMGALFKVLCVSHPDCPEPPGFAE
jgi:NADH dehydrogenase [ubiquinone] 1 alpha subcomplex assembly factor 7